MKMKSQPSEAHYYDMKWSGISFGPRFTYGDISLIIDFDPKEQKFQLLEWKINDPACSHIGASGAKNSALKLFLYKP